MTDVVDSVGRQTAPPLLVSPSVGPRASAVTVTGGGCPPGTTVSISYRGQVLGAVRVSRPGEFSTTVMIPARAKAGSGPVAAAGAGCHRSATFTVQTATATATATPSTPAPPVDSGYGVVEVLAGLSIFVTVLVFAVRRNRRTLSTQDRTPPDRTPPDRTSPDRTPPDRTPKHRRGGRHRRPFGRRGTTIDLRPPPSAEIR